MKKIKTQTLFLIFGTTILSGCISTSQYTLREKTAPIGSITVETTRQKTFPATKWLTKTGDFHTGEDFYNFIGRLLTIPFYPLTALIDVGTFAHKTTYRTAYSFNGIVSLDGAPYSNKTISLSGPVTGELQTDSMGQFDKTFWESEKSYAKPDSYAPLRLVFAKPGDLTSGTTVSMIAPLAIELTLRNEGTELFVENRKELIPHVIQVKDPIIRDTFATEWATTSASKPLNLTVASFSSDKNRQITETENLEAAKRRQEEKKQAELAEQEAQQIREKEKAEKAKKCASQSKRTKGKHLCSTAKLIEFSAGQSVPDDACIYYEDEFQPTPYSFSVLSLSSDGCLYFLGHSKTGDIPQNTNPIYVNKYGNPNEDSPVPDGIHPVHWRKNIHATCGDLDLPLPYGYYEYTGEYSYTALRGNEKEVYSFKKLDIDSECLD